MGLLPYNPAQDPTFAALRGYGPPQPEETDPDALLLAELLAQPDRLTATAPVGPSEAPGEPGMLSKAWETVSYPLKALTGLTGGLAGGLAGIAAPEAYEQAREELGATGGFQPELLPGLGDVLAQLVPEEVRESGVGQALGPVSRIVGNIAGDPTTYSPLALARIASLGKITSVPRVLERAARVGSLGRAARVAGRGISRGNLGTVALGARAAGAALPFSPIAGVAYAPELLEGITTGAQEAAQAAGEGEYGEAAAGGINTLLQAGLAALVAKGAMSEVRARQVAARAARDAAPPEAEAPIPAGRAEGEGPLPEFGGFIRPGREPFPPGGQGGAPPPEPRYEFPEGPITPRFPPEPPVEVPPTPPIRPQEALEAPPTPPPPVQAAPEAPAALQAAEAPRPQRVPAAQEPPATTRPERFKQLLRQGASPRDANAILDREFEGAVTPPFPLKVGKPAPQAAPALELAPPFKPTHPKWEEGLKVVDALEAEGLPVTRKALLERIPGLSRKNEARGNTAPALLRQLVEAGRLEAPGKSGGPYRYPEAPTEPPAPAGAPEEAVRVIPPREDRPAVEVSDESFREVIRTHTAELLAQERAAIEQGDFERADRIRDRVDRYMGALESPARMGEAAPVLREFREGMEQRPAPPEPPPTGAAEPRGEAGYRERVARGVPPEPMLPTRIPEAEPEVRGEPVPPAPRETPPLKPSPAYYPPRELVQERMLDDIELRKVGKAIGGEGLNLVGQARKNLETQVAERAKREGKAPDQVRFKAVVEGRRKQLASYPKALAKLEAQLADTSPRGGIKWDRLLHDYLNGEANRILTGYGGARVPTAYSLDSPAGRLTRLPRIREIARTEGRSPEDLVQDSIRQLLRRYSEGDPFVVDLIDRKTGEEQSKLIYAQLRLGGERGTRRGQTSKEVEGEAREFERPLEPLVAAGREPRAAAPDDVTEAVREAEEAGREVESWALPPGAQRLVTKWHRENDGFTRKPNGDLAPEGKIQLKAVFNQLAAAAKRTHEAGEVEDFQRLLTQMSNLVSAYHPDWIGFPTGAPWRDAEAWLRSTFGLESLKGKKRFEEVARRASGMEPDAWRLARAQQVELEKTGVIREAAPRAEPAYPLRGKVPAEGGPPQKFAPKPGPVAELGFEPPLPEAEARSAFEAAKPLLREGPSARPFAEESGRATGPEYLVGPEKAEARRLQANEAERTRATPVEGLPHLDVVDYDNVGIDSKEMEAVQAFARVAAPHLEVMQARIGALLGEETRLKGFLTSPARDGLARGGDVRQNPLFHAMDAVETARRAGMEEDDTLVALLTSQHASAIADHEGLHTVLKHGEKLDEETFVGTLRELRKATQADLEYRKARLEMTAALTPEVIGKLRAALPVFTRKVEEARRATRATATEGVLAGAPPRDTAGAGAGRGAPGDLEGGAGRGGGPERALPGGARPPGARGEGAVTTIGTGATPELGAPPPRPGRAPLPSPEAASRAFRGYPEEARRVGTPTALSQVASQSLQVPRGEALERAEASATERVKQIAATGVLAPDNPTVEKLRNAVIYELSTGVQGAGPALARSRPARGKEPLRKGELDIAVNLTKHAQHMTENTRSLIAKVMARVDPSDKGKPVTADMVTARVQKMLDAADPRETVTKLQKLGVRNAYDMAFVERYLETAGVEIDQRQVQWAEAVQQGDAEGIKKAEVARFQAAWDLAAVLNVASATEQARILAHRRVAKTIGEPLAPHESLQGRFASALRAHGATTDQANKIYGLFQDASVHHDWRQFNHYYNEVFRKNGLRDLLTVWKANMFGPPTQVANISGNAMFRALRDVEQMVASLIEGVAAVGGRPRERYIQEAKVAWLARTHAAGEVGRTLKQDLSDIATLRASDPAELLERGTPLDEVDIRAIADVSRGKTWRFFTQPLRLMTAADTVFKTLARSEYMFRQAYRHARKGDAEYPPQTGDAAYRRMYDIVNQMERGMRDPMGQHDPINRNYWKEWKKQIEKANDEALRDTFQGRYTRDLFGKTGDIVQRWSNSMPLIDLIIPFKKTPINIAKEAWRRTPMGFYSVWRDLKRWEETKGESGISPKDAAEEFAKPLLGTAIGAGAMMLGLQGVITGQGPQDPYQQQTLKASGWQPYSVKVGNVYMPYNRFEPVSTILGMGADMAEGLKRGEVAGFREQLQRLVGSIQQNLTNKTFLQGLESFFTFWKDPTLGAEPFIKQLVLSAVPNTVGLIPFGTAARAFDPTYRKTTIFNAPLSKIPGASKLLPEQYGTLGEKRERTGGPLSRLFLPVQPTKELDTPAARVAREIDRIGMVIQRPRTYARTAGGRVEYGRGDTALIAGAQRQAIEAIARLIKSPGYLAMPDNEDDPRAALGVETKEDLIRRILTEYRRPALTQVNTRARAALARQALQQIRG